MTGEPTQRRVTLYVRSLAPEGTGDEQVAVVNRLQRLDEQDGIGEFSVSVWGHAVTKDSPLASTDAGERVLDRIAAFEEWAADAGVSLDRFIQREEVRSRLRETTQTVIRFPAMTVAEYVDGNLACVTPHETESRVVSVQDRLDTLEGQSQESG